MVVALAFHLTTALLAVAVSVGTFRRATAASTESFNSLVWVVLMGLIVLAQLLPRRKARVPCAVAYYGWGLLSLAILWNQRNAWAGRLFVWGALCDLAGFALIAALLSWGIPRLRAGWMPSKFEGSQSLSSLGFGICQASLIGVTAVLAGWVAWDVAFAEAGRGVALFGLAGRAAGATAALMLVGATIVMAWQSEAGWRRGWQYASMAAGVLFTSSSSAARAPVELLSTPGRFCVFFLQTWLVSLAMMVFLTRFGLARFLPSGNDWIKQGRRAAPVFAALAMFLLTLLLVQ